MLNSLIFGHVILPQGITLIDSFNDDKVVTFFHTPKGGVVQTTSLS
jgi:hypothetical protein